MVILLLSFSASAFAKSTKETEPNFQELSKETNIPEKILKKRWKDYVKNNYELKKVKSKKESAVRKSEDTFSISAAPTYTSTFDLWREIWWDSKHNTTEKSESTQIIDTIEAKSRIYTNGTLADTQTDSNLKSDYAGSVASANPPTYITGTGTAYGNSSYKLSGYQDVYDQFSENFNY